jgi:hypothetical protein
MSTTVVYNTVTLEEVRILEYRVDSPASFDTPSTGILRHHLSGEALVVPMGASNWDKDTSSHGRQFVIALRDKLNTPRRNLDIRITDSEGVFVLYSRNLSPSHSGIVSDDNNGPFFRANVTQITGTSALLVNFTCEWADSGEAQNLIQSFFCATTFTIDDVGNTTIRKMGSLRMRARNGLFGQATSGSFGVAGLNSDKAGTTDNGLTGDFKRSDIVTDWVGGASGAEFPDQYRRFISGNLHLGFRRIRQEYAHDETRNTLVFDIVDQEYSRGIPAPARVGNCQFTFEREMGSGTQMIGTKHFIASVKGDRFVTAGALLTLCIRLSQNRIDYVRDTIVKIRVTEENMLSENSITFEVLATATSAQEFTPNPNGEVGGSGGTGSLIDQSLLLKNILSPIATPNGVFQFVPAVQSDAYGNSLIVRITPSAFDNRSSTPTLGLVESSVSTYQLGEFKSVVYQFPRAYFDGPNPGNDPYGLYIEKGSPAVPFGPNSGDGSHNGTTGSGVPAVANPPLHSKGGKKIEVSSNIIVVPSTCADGKPRLFQIGSPVVMETEFLDGARKNEPPERTFNDQTSGSALIRASYNITSGVPDMNGNRVMVAGYDRTTIVTSQGDFGATGASATNPSFKKVVGDFGGESYALVVFNPASIKMPIDGTQGEAQPEYTQGLGSPETYLA